MLHVVNKNMFMPENDYIISANEGFCLNKFSSLKLLKRIIKQKNLVSLKKNQTQNPNEVHGLLPLL